MEILEYPLICWQIQENAILGQVLGSQEEMLAENLKSLKSSLSEYIEKQLRDGNYFAPDIRKAKLRVFNLEIRPHYQENERIYPLVDTVKIPITAVYGKTYEAYYECFLPQLDKSFYFYNVEDIEKLVEHFSRDSFHNLSPSEIYKFMLSPTPRLESLSVKVLKKKSHKASSFDLPLSVKTLSSLSERLPFTRKENRKAVPEQAWERGTLIDQLVATLIHEQGNVLLVGKSGVGKSAILRESIRNINRLEKNQNAQQKHSFWRTSPARITAKARYLGEWQMICEDLVYDLERANGILYLENFFMLAYTGGEGPEDSMAAFMTSFIRQGRLKIMSEISPEQLEALRRVLPGFVEYFKLIHIEEMDTESTLRIFGYFNDYTSKNLKLRFTQSAQEIAYVLLDRFVRYESFPGKAIKFLQECTSQAQLEKKNTLELQDIVGAFSLKSGIPDFLLRDDILLKNDDLEGFFKEKIIGQDHIIDKICSIIKVFKAGLNDPNKPLATLIFAGPTGVGKTATAKAISEFFFGMGQKYQALIRLDMSEFQHPGQIHRLIGPEGKLVQHVREKPFSVVLLDEIEKSNPLIFDALLTVLDEGILLDSVGRVTDFRNTIIIMTSNLGSTRKASLGFRSYQEDDYEADIKAFFRPEFYNRIDSCLIFNSLDEDTIMKITRQELDQIDKRDGLSQRKLKLEFTEALIRYVAQEGFDKKYGARPLQREVERLIVAPLARKLMENMDLKNKKIKVDFHPKKGLLFQ